MNPNDSTALTTLNINVWFTSRFKEELTVRPPVSFEDALHRASTFGFREEKLMRSLQNIEETHQYLLPVNAASDRTVRHPENIITPSMDLPAQGM